MVLMEVLVWKRKKLIINFSNARPKLFWSLHYSGLVIIVIFLLIEKKLFGLQSIIKMLNFQLSFV